MTSKAKKEHRRESTPLMHPPSATKCRGWTAVTLFLASTSNARASAYFMPNETRRSHTLPLIGCRMLRLGQHLGQVFIQWRPKKSGNPCQNYRKVWTSPCLGNPGADFN